MPNARNDMPHWIEEELARFDGRGFKYSINKPYYYVNEFTREKLKGNLIELRLRRGVVFINQEHIECGYFPVDADTDSIMVEGIRYDILSSLINPEICYYNNASGCYVYRRNGDKPLRDYKLDPFTGIKVTFRKGFGSFPYSFSRNYEARDHFDLFDKKVKDCGTNTYTLSKFLKYTFGLEFETSMGYIPEGQCFKYGLIPLRDGSISGLEYSTVILQGNSGLGLLENQLKILNCYTAFNKECSLHVHMGGFPLEPEKIFALYKVLLRIQNEIHNFVPRLTFNTSEYKKTRKDYCCLYQKDYTSFETMYKGFAGQPFFGSLTMPHPADKDRNRKWEIHTRYFWVNLINMLCYNGGKTVEFRFLRPSFNFRFIYMWLWVFNAILLYAETTPLSTISKSRIHLGEILSVYPEDIASTIFDELMLYQDAIINQHANEDWCGEHFSFVDEVFSTPSPLL